MTCPAAALGQRSAAACAQLCASWAPLTGWAPARGLCMGARSGPMLGNPVVHKGLRPVTVPQGKLATKEISLSCQTVKVCSPKCYLTPFLPSLAQLLHCKLCLDTIIVFARPLICWEHPQR